MRFYTPEECTQWLTDRGRTTPNHDVPASSERIAYPALPYMIFAITSWIAGSWVFRQPALLWITEWGIWPSSENWHLYYRLRQTYGDVGLLHESPGHLFLEHESEDLASFTQMAMLNGWGGYLLTHANYVNMFFSHDEYMDFYAELPKNLNDIRRYFSTISDGNRLRVDQSGAQIRTTR
jgi:hypothetical protein